MNPEDNLVPQDREEPLTEKASPDVESADVPQDKASPAYLVDEVEAPPQLVAGEEPGTEAVEADNATVLAESRRRTRRSFVVAGAAAVAGYGFYRWLDRGPQVDMVPRLLESTYQANAAVSQAVLREHALAPTYPLSRARTLRVNGVDGLKRALRPESYRLQVTGVKDPGTHPRFVPDVTAWEYIYQDAKTDEDQGHDTKFDPTLLRSAKVPSLETGAPPEQDQQHTGRRPRGKEEAGESYSTLRAGTPGLLLALDDFIPRLPRHEFVTEFKCIEGWSEIVHWGGVRMADFLEMYPPAPVNGREPRYVYMETPDGDYYVGYDLHVCRHPQTLLVTEMMGAPLTQFHGAPLRIHMPTKYGYKQIKRIGLIAYMDEKPDDYWTELGYDWYAGL